MYLTRACFSFIVCCLIVCAGTIGFSKEFEHVMNIGSEGTGEGQFKYVEDFDFDSKGNLLATDAAHAYVQVFDKKTGKFVTRFGGKGDEDYHLEKPEGISVAPDGRIFVADYTTGFVKIYDASYKWLKSFSDYGSEPGENIKSEFTDIYNGLYYMPEAGNHRISVWDLEGNFKFLFSEQGTEEGKLNNPEAAKFNSQGILYVADLKNDRIQIFTKDGKFVKSFGRTGSGPGELKAPAGISFDKDDNLYVGEIGNDRIQVFNKDGAFLTMWGKKGAGNGEFGNIHGVIVDRDTDWIYVADTANNRIQVFKPKI
ncbi:MAG: 6-bladed beta-propeller [Proteobacteria bacterium]|nr:6-bladed beta-propeller [Pseudomonadota bacterium]